MAIQVGWADDSRTIITVTVEGRYTWDELEAALKQAITMMDSVQHKVDFIIDIRKGRLDLGSALSQVQKAATPESHRNEGLKVVVGANRMIRMVYQTYRKMTQAMGKDQVFEFVDTIEDAEALIQRRR